MTNHRLVVAAAALGLGVLAAPAAAVPPVHLSIDPPPNIVEDQGQACGFPVRWTIDLSVEQTRFFDQEGNLVRIQSHVKEDNTIANLSSGLALREGPDSFTQTTRFNDDGSVEIVVTGLARTSRARGSRTSAASCSSLSAVGASRSSPPPGSTPSGRRRAARSSKRWWPSARC